MAESKPNKVRSRTYVAVLYPEDETHAACIEKLKSGGYNFAAILHNQDVYEDGENAGQLKKEHWHVALKFKNAVYNTALSKELGIAQNYLEQTHDLDAALLYMVHFGYESKHQYNHEEVFGPLATRLNSLLADDDESTRALNIYEMIAGKKGRVTYTEVFVEACRAGLYGDFRRMGSGVMALINDHNYEYTGDAVRARAADREAFQKRFGSDQMWKAVCRGKYDDEECPPM